MGPPRPPSASNRLMITAMVASSLSSETDRGDAPPYPPGGPPPGPPPFEWGPPKLTHLGEGCCFLMQGLVVRVSIESVKDLPSSETSQPVEFTTLFKQAVFCDNKADKGLAEWLDESSVISSVPENILAYQCYIHKEKPNFEHFSLN